LSTTSLLTSPYLEFFPGFRFLICRHLTIYSLFPYTTLFRSIENQAGSHVHRDAGPHLSRERGRGNRHFIGSRARVHDSSADRHRSEEHTSELLSRGHLVCRLLTEKENKLHVLKGE